MRWILVSVRKKMDQDFCDLLLQRYKQVVKCGVEVCVHIQGMWHMVVWGHVNKQGEAGLLSPV